MTDNCRGPVIIGKPVYKQRPARPRRRRKRKPEQGKAMNEVACLGVRGLAHSPDSDCNSNHHGSTSYLSNTSSQDIDFQDNSDYQWFLDYGYREGGTNHHTSILSLPESYEANDINYYDALAKNMDANLAEADMESFRTEDIHALLTNLPPMCTDHLSQENNRQGESFASVSGSMMAKFDFDSSISPHSSSHGDDSTSMSICKSELLFSPVKEMPMPGTNFSVDSLDCDLHDMMLTCQANKDNYTIAFEGSVTMYSEGSDYHESDHSGIGSTHWPIDLKKKSNSPKVLDSSMTQSDHGSFTTWSKLKKRNSDNQLRKHPSGNNNNSGDDASRLGLTETTIKSQSMPNLYKQKLKNLMANNYLRNHSSSSSDTCTVKRRPVKVFDIQHQLQNITNNTSVLDMATSTDASSSENNSSKQQQNFSLVKLFMKQKSMSNEGMSTTMDQLSSTENWTGSQSGESNSSEMKNLEQMKNLDVSCEQRTNDSSVRTYDLIAEEPEEDISRSESVEQLSESISKIDSVGDSYEKSPVQQFNINNNNSYLSDCTSKTINKEQKCFIENKLMNRSIQTSQFSEITNLKKVQNTTNDNNKFPYKIIEPSFLNKLKKEGEIEKPVYVLYPNYVLPNLDFLSEKQDDEAKILLVPQEAPTMKTNNKKRPFSCNDLEALKKKGFKHVRDWDSLNFLLPQECRQILSEVPEISEHFDKTNINEKPPLTENVKHRKRPMSCDYSNLLERTNSLNNQTNVSSSSSTATQPSSGYRGSSTILNDSQVPTTNLNPLFVYRYDSVTSSEASLMMSERQRSTTTTTIAAPPLPVRCVSLQQGDHVPPRPPLPKGILRKALEKVEPTKRYSLYEANDKENIDITYKRKSLPEVYQVQRNKRLSETEDEGVDAGTSSSSLDDHFESHRPTTPIHSKTDFLLSNISTDELAQLEEFLKISGISTSDNEELNEENIMQLRSYVSKFLSLKINQEGRKTVSFAEKVNVLPKYLETKQFIAPNNSPNVSAFVHQRNSHTKTLVDMPICEENENSPNYASPQVTPLHTNKQSSDLVQKRCLISAATDAVEQLINHFSPATNQNELNALGDSSLNPACAKLALSTICPALYAILSDGLKPSLETSFGAINNSVWQVVEASAQQGPLTKALNELVMRINSEDAISEGLVKFNAFVFGLLNVRSLDAWASYLRTRESILKKHYTNDSLMIMSHTGGTTVRALMDTLIATLQPLALLPFRLDLLFEFRQLHLSFKRMDSYQQQLSPKHSVSPNFKHWNSSGSNHSNSESEEISAATTIRQNPVKNPPEASLPDLLNSSQNNKTKCRSDKERPRSCAEPEIFSKPNFRLGDVTSVAKKRWSGIPLNSKLYLVYDRLVKEDEEEYTDSLENPAVNTKEQENTNNSNENMPSLQEDGPESLDSNLSDEKPLNGRRFKKLQQKWEMLSGRETIESPQSPPLSPTHTSNKSKIPRPITSPIKPSGIPVPVLTNTKQNVKIVKKVLTPPGTGKVAAKFSNVKYSPMKKTTPNSRTSRVDQLDNTNDITRHIPRPSSLPYKAASNSGVSSKGTPPRRAASSSLSRKPITKPHVPKVVRTLSHRLPSESGHLSYNEGERLKVVLEVDEKWLLCCRGTQKGLVPKSAVIEDLGRF